MKYPLEKRQEVLLAYLAGEMSKHQAANLLGCTERTIRNYKKAYRENGKEGLRDNRHSNYHKLTDKQREAVIALKQKNRWRSGRNIRDHLKLSVHRRTINSIFQV